MDRIFPTASEGRPHAFRRRLPASALKPLDLQPPRDDDRDWKLFLLSFAAFFTVIYSFIF